MTRDWPTALKPYVGPAPNVLVLRPERWASGLIPLMLIGTIFVLLGVIGVVVTDERWSSLAVACIGAAMVLIPGRERLRWVIVEATDTGVNITPGLGRWKSAMQHVSYADVQTVLMQDDEKAYGWGLPILKHVVIERTAAPFAGASAGVRIAEMFGLEDKVLETLRDELAARAGKSPVTIEVY